MLRHVLRRAAVLAPAAVVFLVPSGARGQGAAQPSADEVFQQAKALLKAGDWVGACAKFQESFDIERSVSALVKIARCREHEGRPASAVFEYRRALELNRANPQGPARAKELDEVIRAELTALEASVPRLRIVVSPRPSAVEVRVDGRVVAMADLDAPLPVDPGEREIVVRAPGYRDEHVRLAISGWAQREIRIALQAEERPAPAPPVALPEPAHPASGAQSIVGLIVGGAGVATLGVAGYFGYKTLSLVNDSRQYCDPSGNPCGAHGLDLLNDARQAQTIGIVLAGVGATLTSVGLVLYVTGRAHAAATNRGAALGIKLEPLGMRLAGSW
jgi:hypothetical protein